MSEVRVWIGGWGVRPERFKATIESAIPNASHIVLEPGPDSVEAALNTPGVSHFGGYSLGSLLLLKALDRIPVDAKIWCIAPILAFCREEEMGGTTPRATLENLQVRLAVNTTSALKLFYRMVHLTDEPTDALPYSKTSLEWGLRQLADLKVIPNELERVEAVIGKQDQLLHSEKISTFFERKHLVDGQHDYQTLCSEHVFTTSR